MILRGRTIRRRKYPLKERLARKYRVRPEQKPRRRVTFKRATEHTIDVEGAPNPLATLQARGATSDASSQVQAAVAGGVAKLAASAQKLTALARGGVEFTLDGQALSADDLSVLLTALPRARLRRLRYNFRDMCQVRGALDAGIPVYRDRAKSYKTRRGWRRQVRVTDMYCTPKVMYWKEEGSTEWVWGSPSTMFYTYR